MLRSALVHAIKAKSAIKLIKKNSEVRKIAPKQIEYMLTKNYVHLGDVTNSFFYNIDLDFFDKLKHGAMCLQTLKLNAELTLQTIPPRFN